MKIRSTLCFAGAALWAYCAASAADVSVYSEGFETVTLDNLKATHWNFGDVHSGIATLDTKPDATKLDGPGGNGTGGPITSPTRFLGEFGFNDIVHLNLNLPQHTGSVRIKFDAYLLRTWDGREVTFAGPDTFGYGIAGQTPILQSTFSNGQGLQDYCPNVPSPCAPGTGSDLTLKNKLGFEIVLDPVTGGPPVGTDMSLVYHFDSGPIAFSGDQVTFNFFSKDLQVRIPDTHSAVSDESWGLDNVSVSAVVVPEPQTWALLLSGLLLLSYAAPRRGRPSR